MALFMTTRQEMFEGGTWRKSTEDQAIKQDLGNTVGRKPDVSEEETGQPLKDY